MAVVVHKPMPKIMEIKTEGGGKLFRAITAPHMAVPMEKIQVKGLPMYMIAHILFTTGKLVPRQNLTAHNFKFIFSQKNDGAKKTWMLFQPF